MTWSGMMKMSRAESKGGPGGWGEERIERSERTYAEVREAEKYIFVETPMRRRRGGGEEREGEEEEEEEAIDWLVGWLVRDGMGWNGMEWD